MMMTKKKKGKKIDRLSALPEALVMHIFCFLDTKNAVKASFSLKKWVNFWTLLTDLDFDSSVFKKLCSFDRFVDKVLTLVDDSVKINKLNYRRKGITRSKIINRIVEFVVSHDVQQLTISVEDTKNYSFMDQLASSSSMKRLKLQCGFSGCVTFSDSLSLEHLVTLHLDSVRFKSFNGTGGNLSGYPNLRNLTLRHCRCDYTNSLLSLSIVAPRLSRLIIKHCFRGTLFCKLMISTPSLAFFRIEDYGIPYLQTDDLTLLDVVDMDVSLYLSHSSNVKREQSVSQLISMLKCFYNANSIRLSWSIVELLSMFPDILASEPSPFCNLVSLSIIPHVSRKTFSITIPGHVTTYLLRNRPDANTVVELPSCRKCSKCYC